MPITNFYLKRTKAKMTIHKQHDEILDSVRGILGEHFPNFAFVVLDDDGDLYYDYANRVVGEALFIHSLRNMTQPSFMHDMIFEEEEED